MKLLKWLAVTSALLLTGGMALATAQSAASRQSATTPPQTQEYQKQSMNNSGKTENTQGVHHIMGTVDSISDSSVVISHKYKGQEKTLNFTIQLSTRKVGKITKGARVEVSYKLVNEQRVATVVKAEPEAG